MLHLYLLLMNILFSSFHQSVSLRKIGYFWHLSDFHLDLNYTAFGDVANGCYEVPSSTEIYNNEKVLAGQYGEYACGTPLALVRSVSQAMLEKGGSTPDFVIWTGENCGGIKHRECSLKNILKTTTIIRLELANIVNLGGTMGYPAIGFGDASVIYYSNQSDPHIHPGLEGKFGQMGTIFHHWMEGDMLTNFSKGGFYSHMYSPNLRILGLNTFLFTKTIPYEHDPLGQWTWLEEQLAEAYFKKQKVYLIYSTPPGIYEKLYYPSGVHWFHYEHNRRFLNIIRSYSSIIAGQFAGQYHSDVFRIIYNNKSEPVSWIFVNPSVSPIFKDIPPFVASRHPAIRLYKYDIKTAQVLDYTQFYLDLNLANFRSLDEWEYGYSFTTYYSLPNVSAQSLQLLVNRLNNDESFLDRYFHASNAMFPRVKFSNFYEYPTKGEELKPFRYRHLQYLEGCGKICKRYHLCGAQQLEYEKYHQCISARSKSSSIHISEFKMIAHALVLIRLVLIRLVL